MDDSCRLRKRMGREICDEENVNFRDNDEWLLGSVVKTNNKGIRTPLRESRSSINVSSDNDEQNILLGVSILKVNPS